MQVEFKATQRVEQGTGASRRLRRAGRIPGIIYGANSDAVPISLDHNELYHLLKKETFHASVLSLDLDGAKQNVVLRDSQWHPYKQQVLHLDFQRVAADQKLRLKVPLHFANGDISPAVKFGSCIISHTITELDVECLPANLPEFIEIDLKDLETNESVHISQITLPAGVELVAHGEGDPVVATALVVGGGAGEEGAEGEGEAAA